VIGNRVITGDCTQALAELPSGCADLIFADPPFNIGYEYDQYDDRRAKADYLAFADRWLTACERVLAPNGSFFLAIGDEYVAEHKVRMDELGLTLRNWIVWHYTFGVNCTKKFNRSHAHILYYVKNPKNYTFRPNEIRVPSARMTTYADRRANPVGKLPDDTWVLRPQESKVHFLPEQDTWFESRVCGTFKERLDHPCQMPEAVLERIIRVASICGQRNDAGGGEATRPAISGSGVVGQVCRGGPRSLGRCDGHGGERAAPAGCESDSSRGTETLK
jgi:DNA modification methylase